VRWYERNVSWSDIPFFIFYLKVKLSVYILLLCLTFRWHFIILHSLVISEYHYSVFTIILTFHGRVPISLLITRIIKFVQRGFTERDALEQPFSIFLPWRNPWNNFQVSENPCIKIIISTAHGTLAWSVSCRYNNPVIIVNALLSRELYFSVDLFILANKFKKRCLFFFNHDLSRNP
jgi:hypothetical protein